MADIRPRGSPIGIGFGELNLRTYVTVDGTPGVYFFTLDAFLTERYRFYVVDGRGQLYYGDIDHEPWRLAPAWAEIETNDLFSANGFDKPTADPTLRFAAPIEVTAERIRRLDR